MKNLLSFLFLSILTLFACKKHSEAPVNKLIVGLDPSVTLPNADTTGALSYITGYIDGERFALVEGKDSVMMIDVASPLFAYDYQPSWNNGIGGKWIFDQAVRGYQQPLKKGWSIEFSLPTFGANRDTSQFNAFKRKYATPATFTNLNRCGSIDNLDQFILLINRTDIFNGEWNTLGLGTCGVEQTGSYIKLVSVGQRVYIPGTNYHYEMIYEFDLKLTGNRHLTKGRMKTWVYGMKI